MQTEIKIEKGIPLPRYRNRSAYPWETMDIEDSFLTSPNVRSVAYAAGKKLRRKFACRTQESGEVRVWRTA